jgi:hypothetical protein
VSDPQTPGAPTPARNPGRGGTTPLPGERPRITGLSGYEAIGDHHLWFRAYNSPRKGAPTHSVHILWPTGEPGCFTLSALWQGPLQQLIKDAVAQTYMRKVADAPAEPVQLAFDFAEVA